jgi:hypothetical protein
VRTARQEAASAGGLYLISDQVCNVGYWQIVLKSSKNREAPKISQMMHVGDFSRCDAL